MKKPIIAVLGSGSWGSAVAIHLAKGNLEVRLWGRDASQIERMQTTRCNHRYLPNIDFPQNLNVMADLNQCIDGADDILIATPSHAFATILQKLPKNTPHLAWLTKGIDPQSHHFLSDLVFDYLGKETPIAIISGPSFAMEVALNLPTALTIAGNNPTYNKHWQKQLHHHHIRAYSTEDVLGVQLCGAMKNVLAIACGISDGLAYGANAKAALMTRGLAEMTQLGRVFGAQESTFLGLAGVGDLVLTCTDNQSRNRRFGLLLGQGLHVDDAEKSIQQVVEGKHNAAQICWLAERHHVELPICHAVNQVLNHQWSAQVAAQNLLQRPLKIG